MIAIYIVTFLILAIIVTLLIPIRLKIYYSESERKNLKVKNRIEIYILYFFKIKTIRLENKKKIKSKNYNINAIYKVINSYMEYYKNQEKMITKKEISDLINNIYYEKMDITLKINLKNPILNSYIISIINIIINIFIIKNQKRMNLKNTRYFTTISDNIFNANITSIVRIKLINIIAIVIKIGVRAIKLKSNNKKSNVSNQKKKIALT